MTTSATTAALPARIVHPDLSRILDLATSVSTPALLIDPVVVAANYRRISAAFGHARIYYAVKANPHPTVVQALGALGCGLDVASGAEVDIAHDHGVHPQQICFSAPFKRGSEIARAFAGGVTLFAADSHGEVANIARHAPGSRILVRAAITGGDSLTPMGNKFGANPEDVVPLLEQARQLGLVPYGLHFHVGSQCLDPLAWSRAIAECAPLWHAACARGMDLQLIDIGGGFPVIYDMPVPSIESIAGPTLAAARVFLGPDVELAIEPGRWMTTDAAVLVSEVIGVARRGTEDWVYLDAGVYNGLIDTVEGVVYPLHAADELASGLERPRGRATIAGPSCDGNDVLFRQIDAPHLAIGDRVLLFQAGAYTTAFERFNGLRFPEVATLRSDLARSA